MAVQIGFYGKLPVRADFVARGLPEHFLTPIGDWIEHSLAAGRKAMGARWSDAYLTSPVWHFALSAGLAGPLAVTGVMVPSVDRSGREFPFLVAVCNDEAARPAALAVAAADWLERAGEIAVAAVTRNTDPGRIEADLAGLAAAWRGPARRHDLTASKTAWTMTGIGRIGEALPHLVDHAALALGRPSLWWSDGSAQVDPTTFVCDGLPDGERFVTMIAGRDARR